MKIAFCSQMGFVGKIPRDHKNMRVEFAPDVCIRATHFPLYNLGTDPKWIKIMTILYY